MIKRKTVLVLGAGASAPYGFPSGQKLVDDVCAGLSKPSNQFFTQLEGYGFDGSKVIAFRDALHKSAQPSIDVFLEHRPEFLELGKTAIAASLIPYEVEDNLFGVERNWYKYLWKHLGPSLLEDVAPSRLSVITFNYDRSLEHFLFTSLKNSFDLTDEKAARYVVQGIPIMHVYGKLGDLPHMGGNATRPYTPGGKPLSAATVHSTRSAIKIISEGVNNDVEFAWAKKQLHEAEVICFLGFGYLTENLRRLGIAERSDALVWGSAYRMGDGEKAAVDALFRQQQRPIQLGFEVQDVLELLRQFPVLG